MLWCTEKFENKELAALLHENSCQVQAELAESLEVDHTTVLKYLKASELIKKQGLWVLYELKLRDAEQYLVMCKPLLQWQKRKGFWHFIMTGYEKWIYYNNPKY